MFMSFFNHTIDAIGCEYCMVNDFWQYQNHSVSRIPNWLSRDAEKRGMLFYFFQLLWKWWLTLKHCPIYICVKNYIVEKGLEEAAENKEMTQAV